MSKWLLIGDCHAVEEELDDLKNLMEGVKDTIRQERPDYVLFMGDQHHTHKILNVEVLAFWHRAFSELSVLGPDLLALVGNHDMPGDSSSSAHAMIAYGGLGLKVIDRPTLVDEILLVPYRHKNADFVNDVLMVKSTNVLCHVTFEGSRYENGMYTPDGVSLEGLGDRTFISGHIHTPQRFGNVTYIGAPRWRSLSDVGIERGLALVELENGKTPVFLRILDTAQWCQKLVRVEVRQGQPIPDVTLPSRHKYIVDIYGDHVFCAEQKARWAGCRVRIFKTQSTTRAVSESMGINKAIQVFVDAYSPKYGTSVDVLRTMVNSRLGNS